MTKYLVSFILFMFAAQAFAENPPIIEVNPPNLENAPFRVGAGLDAGFSSTRAGFNFAPQTVLIAEYCVAAQFCVTGSGQLFFGEFSFVNGDRGADGFDGAISLGGRYIFTPGSSEFSAFGSVNAGYQDFGALDRATFGFAAGIAFEQELWKNIRARISTPLLSFDAATNFGFGVRLAVSPTGAIVFAF